MKVAHKNRKVDTIADISTDWKAAGSQMENEGDNKNAIKLYEAMLKKQMHNAYIYDRLMILYRKEKNYKKELSIITSAIKKFTELLQPRKNSHSKKIANLSRSILHSVGLATKKGQALYQPQPIARWEKRKKITLKKIHGKE